MTLENFDDVLKLAKQLVLEAETPEEAEEVVDSLVYATRSESYKSIIDWFEVSVLAAEDNKLDIATLRSVGFEDFMQHTQEIEKKYPTEKP